MSANELLLKGQMNVAFMPSSVVTVKSHYDFPVLGDPEVLYVAEEENATYRWDNEKLLYFCVGRDYKEIELLNGGNANG